MDPTTKKQSERRQGSRHTGGQLALWPESVDHVERPPLEKDPGRLKELAPEMDETVERPSGNTDG